MNAYFNRYIKIMAKHLTAAVRGKIEILHQKDFSLTQIALEVGYHKSTISREISKRKAPLGYFANIAQTNYEEKRKSCTQACKLDSDSRLSNMLFDLLAVGWSPEAISGRLFMEYKIRVSTETIYRYLYTNPVCVRERMCQYLRYARKKRMKYTGRSVHRSKIPNRTSIHTRPSVVAARTELGHWEGDSVLYAHKQAVTTLNELKSGLVRFQKLERKTAENTKDAIVTALRSYEAKTLTLDNGTEFVRHEEVTKEIGIQVFFADPYSSWQRGSNENCNMLLRGFLPKRADIRSLSQEELDEIAEEMNNRPRKRLGWRTPNEVYFERHDKLITFYRCI